MKNDNYVINVGENKLLKNQLVFVCGSALQKSRKPKQGNTIEKTDKRVITDKYIRENHKDLLYALIIDDFLLVESFINPNLDLKFMEELIAEISFFILNYLETFSAATELGLFTSKSSNSRQVIVLPHREDIVDSNIGFFANNVAFNNKNDQIHYTPAINHYLISNYEVQRRYFFVDNKLPNSIAEYLKHSIGRDIFNNIRISYSKDNNNKFHIEVSNDGDEKFNVIMHEMVVFRLVGEICSKSDFDRISTICELDRFESALDSRIKTIVKNTIELELNVKVSELSIVSSNGEPIKYVLKYLIEFFCLFYSRTDDRKAYFNLTRKNPKIEIFKLDFNEKFFRKFDTILKNKQSINLQEQFLRKLGLYHLVEDSFVKLKMQKQGVEGFIIGLYSAVSYYNNYSYNVLRYPTKKKVKKFVTYKNDKCGEIMKHIHSKLKSTFDKDYHFNANSYAYKPGSSIRECVENHIDSRSFYKLDIKNFFGSIDIEILTKKLCDWIGLEYDSESIEQIAKLYTFNGKVPLGFICSPYLSDLYMNDFDRILSDYCVENQIVYTRYSDDILISSSKDNYNFEGVRNFIIRELESLKLTVNQSKEDICYFSTHFYIRYIGLNIVKKEDSNIITVSKSYAKRIVKQIIYLDSNTCNLELSQIIGKINYVAYVDKHRLWNIRIPIETYMKQNESRISKVVVDIYDHICNCLNE